MGGDFIINPLWFYIFNVCENLGSVFTIGAFVIGVFTFIVFGICDIDIKEPVKLFKKLAFSFVLFIFLAILTPSQKTCYQMMIASLATEENLKIATDSAQNVIDYIIEKVDVLLEEEKAE